MRIWQRRVRWGRCCRSGGVVARLVGCKTDSPIRRHVHVVLDVIGRPWCGVCVGPRSVVRGGRKHCKRRSVAGRRHGVGVAAGIRYRNWASFAGKSGTDRLSSHWGVHIPDTGDLGVGCVKFLVSIDGGLTSDEYDAAKVIDEMVASNLVNTLIQLRFSMKHHLRWKVDVREVLHWLN